MLKDLANKLNVATEYLDSDDKNVLVDDKYISLAIESLGYKCSSEEEIKNSIEQLEKEEWQRVCDPTIAVIKGKSKIIELHFLEVVADNLNDGDLTIRSEGGVDSIISFSKDQFVKTGETKTIDSIDYVKYTLTIPELEIGYYELNMSGEFVSYIIVSPQFAPQLNSQNVGFMSQFYSQRSHKSWGVGDFEDLKYLGKKLVETTNSDYLLINPVHADSPTLPENASPYYPASRMFVNPLYIRPQNIPEYQQAPLISKDKIDRLSRGACGLNKLGTIDRDASWALKRMALREIFNFGFFNQERADKFKDFKAKDEENLTSFALWCVLEDFCSDPENSLWTGTVDWRLLSPADPEITAFGIQHAGDIEFYRWLQFIADEQFAAANLAMKEAGAKIGLVADLAVGVNSTSADVWSHPSSFVKTAAIGAPPDVYNQKGQDWGLPPLNPLELEKTGYKFFRQILRSSLKNTGALRIDHVFGMFRLWFVPTTVDVNGKVRRDPRQGTYVYYNREAMLGILVLEAHLNNAIIIGEDMGTIPPGVFEYLKERGILGTSILWFEREKNGDVRKAENLRELCLTSVHNHDIPPTLSYLKGLHVELRSQLGLLTEDVNKVRAEQQADKDKVIKYLISENLLTMENSKDDYQIMIALEKSLFKSPSQMICFTFTDSVGELRSQNVPGTNLEYPNWEIALADLNGEAVFNEELFTNKYYQ
ncbi:MAG: 4-alpha-glucanotransferase, partial [Candidatus Ancillula sp.]|nr:4-alpha-glucanotransferase [Candidatus Ancillula sp.]